MVGYGLCSGYGTASVWARPGGPRTSRSVVTAAVAGQSKGAYP